MKGSWGTLKQEKYYSRKFTRREDLVLMIEDYINYYNNGRYQQCLKSKNSITSSPTAFNGSIIIVSLSCVKCPLFRIANGYATERSRGSNMKNKRTVCHKTSKQLFKNFIIFPCPLDGEPIIFEQEKICLSNII
ncbi:MULTISPECIES: IS3 family transposase [unclassified Enterococcus]